MNFTTSVGRKLAKRYMGLLESGRHASGPVAADAAELRRLLGDGVVQADAVLARIAVSGSDGSIGDSASIAQAIDEMKFQTSILAMHSALEGAGAARMPRHC